MTATRCQHDLIPISVLSSLTVRIPSNTRGSGGPTGCSEAFLTVMGDDGFLPGVLLLLHTVRKYAQVDRDFIVLVSTQVTDDVIERLLSECVRVVQV